MTQKILFLSFSICLALGCAQTPKQSPEKPNIIFIMSDDQGYADLGVYGSKHVLTPNLDKMAAEGMRFTQAYAGSPVCGPTRCSLLTGLHTGHATRRDNRASFQPALPFGKRKLVPLKDEDYTLGEMLKEAGYATAAIGKWGVGNPGTTGTPWKQGFDHFYGYIDQVHAHSYYPTYLMRNADTIPLSENENGNKGQYTHELLANDALDFIRKNKDNPFFLYLPFTLPHGRYEIPDNSLYADKKWPERVKNYAAMISLLDRDIGRIFDLLKELNLDENTIVFFTSDNGPNPPFIGPLESNKPLRGIKRQLLEGGIRVPMIVRWPNKVPVGIESDFMWTFYDVMPTLADIANIESPKNTDGISVLSTLLGKNQQPHEFLYWEFYSPFHQAVRIGDWKGIRPGTEEPIHLYNLERDIQETENVAADHPEIVRKMAQIMEQEHVDSEYWPTLKSASQAAIHMLNPNE